VLHGEDGHLSLNGCIDVAALKQAMRLDGKFLLVTNDRSLSGAKMVARYGEKDEVEKDFQTIEGPIKVRPVFLHKDERIEAVSSFRERGLPCGLCGSLCTPQLFRSVLSSFLM
jgi:hypothetical protein